MLILLDNNAPRGLARALAGHVVTEARERGWATLKNGVLLSVAEEAGFDVLVTAERNIKYQQNLAGRKIAIVVLSQLRWRLVRGVLAEIAAAVSAATPAVLPRSTFPTSESSRDFRGPMLPRRRFSRTLEGVEVHRAPEQDAALRPLQEEALFRAAVRGVSHMPTGASSIE